MGLIAWGAGTDFVWTGSPSVQGYVVNEVVYATAAKMALQYKEAVVFDINDTFDTLQKRFGENFWNKKMAEQALSLAWDFVIEQKTFLGHYSAAFIAPSIRYAGMTLGVVVGEAGPRSVTYSFTTTKSTITGMGIIPVGGHDGQSDWWDFPQSDVNHVNAMLNVVRAKSAGDSKNMLYPYAFALRLEEPQPSMQPLMMKKIARATPLPDGDDIALGFVMQDFDSETGHAGKRKILALVQNIPCAPGYNDNL